MPATIRPMGKTAGMAEPPIPERAGATGAGPGARPGSSLTARSFSAYQDGVEPSLDTVHYGPGIPTEADLRLLGNVEGKRVLELGCGGGAAAVALARQGARVVAVDESTTQIGHARWMADRHQARLELRQGDLADLAFLRADTIDAAYSVYTLGTVDDLDRVFRQVHRVLRPEAAFVISLAHPAFRTVAAGGDPPAVVRAYFDRAPAPWPEGPGAAVEGVDYTRTVADLFTSLTRANFRVDVVLEPEPRPGARRDPRWAPAMAWLPPTLIMRARKLGI